MWKVVVVGVPNSGEKKMAKCAIRSTITPTPNEPTCGVWRVVANVGHMSEKHSKWAEELEKRIMTTTLDHFGY